MEHAKKAEELFKSGYNCAQAVLGAFCEDIGLDLDTAMKISSSFGGGMGRMRSVCGACTGMFMVAGMLYGYSAPETGKNKADHYELIRNLAGEFEKENGSIICRRLLGEGAEVGGTPKERNEIYYKTRPCAEYVKSAAVIMENYINSKKEL